MSEKQLQLKKKHGTPDEFEKASYRAFADLWITWEEHVAAVYKYRQEWLDAGQSAQASC